MPDYVYEVRCYIDVNWLGRGKAGPGVAQNNSNIGGVGPNQLPGTAASGQTILFVQREMVPNAIATPPTTANIVTAITTAANSLGNQITPQVLAKIQNWALGQE